MTRLYLCQVWFPPLSAKCFPALMWKWNRKQLLIRFSSRRISVKGLQPLRCELFHSRGCQIIGNPEHTQKPAQPSVKFQSEASSCYMSNCEKENFWPTFDCQAVVEWPCVLWDTDTSTKAKPKETRSFILSLSSGSIEAINVFVFTSARDWHPS